MVILIYSNVKPILFARILWAGLEREPKGSDESTRIIGWQLLGVHLCCGYDLL